MRISGRLSAPEHLASDDVYAVCGKTDDGNKAGYWTRLSTKTGARIPYSRPAPQPGDQLW
jgi:hypothetical protein